MLLAYSPFRGTVRSHALLHQDFNYMLLSSHIWSHEILPNLRLRRYLNPNYVGFDCHFGDIPPMQTPGI
jgi:hypothetical protein